MLQFLENLGFADEPLVDGFIGREVRSEHLHGALHAVLLVDRQVDNPHAPDAQLALEPEGADASWLVRL